jgi:hypothetical protein
LVPTGSLGPIHRCISFHKEPVKLDCSQSFRSHANADGEFGRGMFLNKRPRFAGHAKTFRDQDSNIEVNARQKYHNLVSALSSHYR